VFLIDTSGSMYEDNKLPLVQQSFAMLAENLDENDKVSIVTYAGEDTVVLSGHIRLRAVHDK
jgi:von Willebrand factor type A domain.